MLIAHISDCHIALPAPEGSDRSGDLRRSVDYVNRLDPQPDLVVHTGDVAHDAKREEYAKAVSILDRLQMRLCAIPGNRDDRAAFRTAFAGCLPDNCHNEFIQYAMVCKRCCAIMLDSISTQSNKGRLCAARLAHFEAMLSDAGDRPVVVFMHHPPFEVTESNYPIQFEDWGEVDTFSGIISRHRNVKQIFCGHSHRTAKGKVASVDASTIPSMAVDLRMGPPAGLQEVLPVYRLAGK
jgi:3',5'-cyclic AMP phosphodiesterase CpdA